MLDIKKILYFFFSFPDIYAPSLFRPQSPEEKNIIKFHINSPFKGGFSKYNFLIHGFSLRP